jgi:apolipoprotein D and lipocalin family protein
MIKQTLILLPLSIVFAGCASAPSGIQPVQNFEINRYLGTWYEIARLDHSFERGLTNVSATYSLRKDGGIDVLNKGFDERSGKWKQIKGRAYFVKQNNVASLKVTFFWPFYGGYNVIALDNENYSYALVCGPGRSYLWILAREKTISPDITAKLVKIAETLNFKVDNLIFVKHNM